MKKFLAYSLTLMLFSALFTGCSGKASSSSAAPTETETVSASSENTESESTSASTGDLEATKP